MGSEADAFPFSSMGFTVPMVQVVKPTTFKTKESDVANLDSLVDANEYSYLVTITVGGQLFPVIFDTGSADLWVVSSECTDVDCLNIKKYTSTTELIVDALPFSLNYLTGYAAGSVAFETIGFGTFEVSQQVLALANTTTNMGLTSVGASGVLGLAFPDEASISGTVGRSLLDNVFASLDTAGKGYLLSGNKSVKITRPELIQLTSSYLRTRNSPYHLPRPCPLCEPASRFLAYKLGAQGTDSSFSVGQLDASLTAHVSDFFFTPVYPAGEEYDYWKVQLQGLTINSQPSPFPLSASKLSRAPCPIAVLDSGTTLVLGPSRDVDNLWKAVGASRKGSDGRWQVQCSHNVIVGLVLGSATENKEFVISPTDLSWQAPGLPIEDGWCVGGIQSNDGIYSGDWLLGDTFLRNVYVVHQAAGASSPPAVGLLSTVNVTDAQSEFASQRGPDPSPHPTQSTRVNFIAFRKPADRLSPFFFLASALFLAFLGSATFTFLFRAKRAKKIGRKSM